MFRRALPAGRRAFTLVELLVVISIIGLLSSIAVVSMSSSREKARLASAMSFDATLNRTLGSALAAEYLFEEGSGTATDTSGNGNNTALTGAPTWSSDTFGASSAYSMNFAGGNYITPASGFGISNSNFTIALWIKTVGASGQMYVVGNTISGGNGYRFGLHAGKVGFLIGNVAYGNKESACSSQMVNDGKWHHIVGVFSRTDLLVSCYIDGHIAGTIALTYYYSGSSDAAPRIGTATCCTVFTGQLDNVRIYTQNLSGLSINALYNEEKSRFVLANEKLARIDKNDLK